MTVYHIVDHPLLSPEARSLSTDPDGALEEQAAHAEYLLGYDRVAALTGADLALARRAVVLQVNHQVERGVDASVYSSLSIGIQSGTYRVELVSAEAAAIARRHEVLPAALGAGPVTAYARTRITV